MLILKAVRGAFSAQSRNCWRFLHSGTAKTTVMDWKMKMRLGSRRIEEVPQSYLPSIMAKELWAVKMSLRGVRAGRGDGAGNLSGLLRQSLVLSARL